MCNLCKFLNITKPIPNAHYVVVALVIVADMCAACGNFLATYTRLIATQHIQKYVCAPTVYAPLSVRGQCLVSVRTHTTTQRVVCSARKETNAQTQRKATVWHWARGLRLRGVSDCPSSPPAFEKRKFVFGFAKRKRIKHPFSVAVSLYLPLSFFPCLPHFHL